MPEQQEQEQKGEQSSLSSAGRCTCFFTPFTVITEPALQLCAAAASAQGIQGSAITRMANMIATNRRTDPKVMDDNEPYCQAGFYEEVTIRFYVLPQQFVIVLVLRLQQFKLAYIL